MVVHIAQRRFHVGIAGDSPLVKEYQSVGVRQSRFQRMLNDDDSMTVFDIEFVYKFVESMGSFGVQS